MKVTVDKNEVLTIKPETLLSRTIGFRDGMMRIVIGQLRQQSYFIRYNNTPASGLG